MTDCSHYFIKKKKESTNCISPAGLHDKHVPLCIKHVLSAQCAGQGVSQLLPYTPDLKHP